MPQATGSFHVANGQILDPAGNPFTARGICVFDYDLAKVSTGPDATPLLNLFPGINIVRLDGFNYFPPSYYADFISALTSKGIVVEIEDHTTSTGTNGGGSVGDAYTGDALKAETDWFGALAAAYKDNPFVWFGSMNEPPNQFQGALTAQEVATYDAIRGAGNNNPILMEVFGGSDIFALGANNPQGMWPDSAYASMTNIVWDLHQYDWLSDYSSDPVVIQSYLDLCVKLCQEIPSADGLVPVMIAEYGISTEGQEDDPGGMAVARVVQQNPYGGIAWNWRSMGGSNNLTDGNNNLTPYGKEVAQWIASGAATAAATGTRMPDIVTMTANGTQQTLITGTSADGSVFSLTAANAVQAIQGPKPATMSFLGAGGVGVTGSGAAATITATAGLNFFLPGAGPMVVTGGVNADTYMFWPTSGFLTINNFVATQGDNLQIAASLQKSMAVGPDGAGGTLISFGPTSAIDVRGVSALPAIHWT